MNNSITTYCNKIFFNPYMSLIIAALSFVVVMYGNSRLDYSVSLGGVMLFWMYGMAYGFVNLYDLYCYAIFQFLLFVFLLSRPVLAEVYGAEWMYWSDDVLGKSMLIILISEVSLYIGAYIIRKPQRFPATELRWNKQIHSIVQTALLILLISTGVVCLYSEVRHFLTFRYMSYEAIYTDVASSEPMPIRILATLFPYSVFAYLATMPDKRKSVLILFVYIIMGLPTFLLGNRTSLVLKIAFATVYFFIRDYAKNTDEPEWITRRLKIGFSIFVITAIAFLGAYNYVRAGKSATDQTYMPLIADFFYRQGTTYDTLCQGFQYEHIIRSFTNTIYSLGPIIDNIRYNFVGRILFGTSELGSGNSINMVLNSSNLAHRLSYAALGESSYLQGYGRGSTFLLETFFDGGYIFVSLFSMILGAMLSRVNVLIQQRNWVLNVIVLFALSSVFMCPRSSACEFMTFLFTPHFWLMMAYVLMAVVYAKARVPFIKTALTQ